ncbi:MAG: NnrU family protein [Pseudomonadales bacterium]|jgi:uncharacterized membrane protein|nr:NnrU family protein [Pseudomonadales bacterium]MDP6469757.1 NnrU family protein [Pseudomonadales bacterium]MDP6827641.1 NnrU family protein [Pseudomonadales bacterium]MDP6971918.1 NnrU family protein [Pseudomonadales bacterium]|tara:strand:- start:502 stop:1062 length:561 start_codon:yes stop_codon:yes gene_type:complete
MTFLVLGLVLFIGVHMVPSMGGLKGSLTGKLGATGYQGVYSLLSLAGLGLIIFGMMQAPFENLWVPPAVGGLLCFGLMAVAVVLYVGAFMPSSIKHFTRHPMLWGTFAWACAHLLANGDLASLLLFAGFGAFAIAKVFLIGAGQTPELGPRQPITKDIILLVVAGAVYGLLTYFHQYLSGEAILSA